MSFKNREPHILSYFLHKTVVVEAGCYEIEGTFRGFQLGSKKPHAPAALILENTHGKLILRTWTVVKTNERVVD